MKKDYIFLSISIDITLMPIYNGRPEIQVTSLTLSTNVNTTRVGLVSGGWDLSLPEIFSNPGNPVSMYHLPILLIKLKTNHPLMTYHKIKSIHSILNKFEKIADGRFILSTFNKQKLQDGLIKELISVYGDKILRVNKL